ncbi:MAG: hypothetical protein U5L04_09775, partial [Trueperaceae bacterium]|nr:hypothetical protein [Trueperaceae bacterium]
MKRTIDPEELVITPAEAQRQPVEVVPLSDYHLRQLRLPKLEVLPMPTIKERDLLFRAVINPDSWGGYRYTTPYRLTVCYLNGPTPDGIGAVLDVALERDPARRPEDAEGTGIIRHDCTAVLARVPAPDGYRLEVLHRSAGGLYSRADSIMRPLL